MQKLKTSCCFLGAFAFLALLFTACAENKPHSATPLLGRWDVDVEKTLSVMPKDKTTSGDFLRVGILFYTKQDTLVFATTLDGYPQREAIVNIISQQGNSYVIEILTEIEYNPKREKGKSTGVRNTFTLIDDSHVKMDTPNGTIYYQRAPKKS